MIIGIIGLVLGSVATALVLKRPAKSTDEKLRDLKARINANAEVAQKNLTRTLCGSEKEQKLKRIKKITKQREDKKKLEAFRARKAK